MGDFDSALELRLAQLSTQLDEARRRADLTSRENDSLKIELIRVRRKEEIANGSRDDFARKNAAMKEELAEAKRMEEDAHIRERDLTTQNSTLRGKLDRSRQREKAVIEMRDELTRENATLKNNLAAARRNEEIAKSMNFELAAKNFTLKGELDEMRGKAVEDHARIDELTCSTGHCEKEDHLAPFPNPDNIFEMCCPNSCISISIDSAMEKLQSGLAIDWEGYYADERHYMSDYKDKCEMCRKEFASFDVFDHFFSQEHIDNVRARGSGVQKIAVQNLEWELRSATFWQESYDEEEEDDEEDEDEIEEEEGDNDDDAPKCEVW